MIATAIARAAAAAGKLPAMPIIALSDNGRPDPGSSLDGMTAPVGDDSRR